MFALERLPQRSLEEPHKPRELLKGGCHMIINGIKALVNSIKFTGITINIGFIGLNFAGGSSKANIF